MTIGGCIDEEDDNLDVTITQQGTKGTAVVIGDNTPNPTIQYTASAVGSDTIKFKANDGTGDSNEATLTTTNTAAPANAAPVCTGAGNRAVEVGKTTDFTCTDADGDALDVSITQSATRGTVTIVGDNTPHPDRSLHGHGGGGRRLQVQGQRRRGRLRGGHGDHRQHEPGHRRRHGWRHGNGRRGRSRYRRRRGPQPQRHRRPDPGPAEHRRIEFRGRCRGVVQGRLQAPSERGLHGPGPDCAASTAASGSVPANLASASAKRKTIKLGGSSFKVKSGKKGQVTVKLTRKGLRALKRAKRLKMTVTITVKRGTSTVTKKVKVTLKAPKRR